MTLYRVTLAPSRHNTHIHNTHTHTHTAPQPTINTCETMGYIAQFLTVFFANVTNQREATPDCRTIEPNCNNITCTFIDNSYYNLDILPCVSPPVLHLEFHAPNGTAIVKHTFNPGTQTERIDEDTQVKVSLGHAPDLITLQVSVHKCTLQTVSTTEMRILALLLTNFTVLK